MILLVFLVFVFSLASNVLLFVIPKLFAFLHLPQFYDTRENWIFRLSFEMGLTLMILAQFSASTMINC